MSVDSTTSTSSVSRDDRVDGVSAASGNRTTGGPLPSRPVAEPGRAARSFSFAQARTLIGDLTAPNPRIYWTDFLLSIFGGYLAFAATLHVPRLFWPAPWVIPVVIVSYLITIALFMRSVMFIHELVHLPKKGFRGFRIAWNLLCGIPFFVPSFLYYPHVDHHRRKHYGTDHDGEYLALSHHSRWLIIGFIVQAMVIPFLGLFRFVVLSPICWFIPGARQWVHRHASTMLVDPFYQRNDASPELMRIVLLQEFGCFVAGCMLLFRQRIVTGEWFDPLWIVAYAVAIGLLTLNEVRTLGAHRWTGKGEEMTFEEQLLDSVNYPDHAWISELWGPIGTRYHALHHLFPRLPYHHLPEAHRRLVEGLPPDSPYHDTIATSLTKELVALWRRAQNRDRADKSAKEPAAV
ncbi:fatty acid desaturase [Roseiconus nitratireducens]|uniref:Fatty acid desaturase n=1 Tax=Roseiconus nitratireducens TaxID=2605748 RepID=A0A5M6DIK5_9BACT|nr:fatty acid desaturase [Roseiconus nitratireducens]KAA5546206.1 fatty acid desaturase [Roseiconus nitratireducens]